MRVTSLCPGAVDTELVASVPGVVPSANRIPPDTIADTVSFLLSLPNTFAPVDRSGPIAEIDSVKIVPPGEVRSAAFKRHAAAFQHIGSFGMGK